MALGTIYATVPAFVAAAALYFLDRKPSTQPQEHGGGIGAYIRNMVTEAKEEVKTSRMPKLAPQFDGLHCFETLRIYE
ncbi:hypothetical protein CIPAW_06G041500 [Carya illinoinensis]|uniref:Uncharacterized protein n=1 Tax=Carya illinoinensis TaxID=32201 RepID=A0A8T1Q7P0_CARIL|nr:hypothetical protein CIPAW_06G041500 [Carya illinoinensis]